LDAITLLKNDHRTVNALFVRFEKAREGAYKEKQALAEKIVKELSIHTSIEEQLFYPVARTLSDALNDHVLESLEEHHGAKATLAEIERMASTDERFDAKMTVLIESVRHHVKEEEQDWFPMVRKQMKKDALASLGEALQNAKRGAPTHPDPLAPDTPPGNDPYEKFAGIISLESDKDASKDNRRSPKRVNARSL
jgi:hemerythrin superfamily protein